MASSSGKRNKAKPSKLTEFFHTSTTPPLEAEKLKELTPLSSRASPMCESADTETRDMLPAMSTQESSMHQILQTFRLQLQNDFKSMISEFKADIQSLVSRTEHVEKKMAEFAKSHNTLIDSHSTMEEEVTRLSAKVLDLEDRSRRNNIRIRGVPESVLPESLRAYLTDLMAAILPTCNSLDLTIDRIHRIPKPKTIPPHLPRDTIARIHFFHIKDEFLKALRKSSELPERFRQLAIYPDLSAATMLKRREFAPLTKILREQNIQYRWGFPVKLIIYREGVPIICNDPASAKDALQKWNMLITPTNSPPRKRVSKPSALTPLWSDKHSGARMLTGD